MKNVIKNMIPLALLTTAIIQWYGIGERTYDAWWMWYKFKDYGGGGHTTVSMEMTVETYVLSLFLIASGLLVRFYCQLSLISRRINAIAVGMLMVGIGWLSLLLVSPFAVIVDR
jgi:hypothetical protein